MASDIERVSEQWGTVRDLLSRWRSRARLNQSQHWETTKHFQRLHYAIGVPVVVLSAVVGTTVFATLQKQVGFKIQLTVGGISLLAAILAGLQTFYGFSALAERHKSVAAAYGAIRRRLELLATLPVELRGDLSETLKAIEAELDSLAKGAPTVPTKIFESVQKRLASDPENWIEGHNARLNRTPGAAASYQVAQGREPARPTSQASGREPYQP